tara:strand:+ start:73 stop:645 length:573 start_codon:yes stop_codon:yes gene_type:complete
MTKIYFKSYSNRKQESAFFEKLTENFEKYEHIEEDYILPHSMLSNHIKVRELINKLKSDQNLSALKRDRLIEVLKPLPDKLKVAKKISDVSVDFTIHMNNIVHFIEFHEKQHRNLSDKRLKPIFTPDNDRIEIPRYAQRFLKDFWRFENLENFKIVWWDWFLQNQSFDINDLNNEYYLKDKFNFNALIKE